MRRLVVLLVILPLMGLLGCEASVKTIPTGGGGNAASQSHGALLVVDDQDFESVVLQSETPVLVDFFATWCGPCKMIAPAIAEIAEEYEGRAKVVKVDVDVARRTARQYGIQAMPTLVVFKNGVEVERIQGAVGKGRIAGALDSAL